MKQVGQKKYRMLISDTDVPCIYEIDENSNVIRTISDVKICFSLFRDGLGNIVCPNYDCNGGSVISIASDGTKREIFSADGEIFSCHVQENGNIVIGDLAASRIVEIDCLGKILKEIEVDYHGIQHECMRMVRKTEDGYFLVQPGTSSIIHFDLDGNEVKRFATRPDAFGVAPLSSGELYYTCMAGIFKLDKDGREIWSFTDADAEGINIRWILDITLTDEGNLLVCNWMGHGHLDEGVHFFEITPDKDTVWQLDCKGEFKTPGAFFIY